MVIDSHQHVMVPAELQLDKMREAGLDQVILFSTAPHPEKAEGLEQLKGEMAALNKVLAGANTKEANMQRLIQNIEPLAQRIREYPGQFLGFGPVPLGLTDQEIGDWMERCVIGNGFCGAGEFTPGTEEQVRQLESIFQAVSAFKGFPVWVHTFSPVTMKGIQVLMGLCKKYPLVPVIFGHMGGTNWMEVLEFAKGHVQVYLDLSAAFTSLAARTAVREVPERCLFSSDAPYGEPYLYRQMVQYVSPTPEITRMVLGENIERLLKVRG